MPKQKESVPEDPVISPKCWVLARSSVNQIQADSIRELLRTARRAHFVNVKVRINGEWREFEADWLKHLEAQP